jgi:dihydrofolate reductase
VASSTLEDASWPGTTIIAPNDLERTVQQLKSQQGGPIVVPGSGQLVHSLTAANLVDRYQLWIHPVAVGAGKRLFNGAVALRPMHSTSTPTGVTILELEPETATAAIRRA